MTTYLAAWSLGPAQIAMNDEPLTCTSCPALVTENEFCEGCGEPICSICRRVVDGEARCTKCNQ